MGRGVIREAAAAEPRAEVVAADFGAAGLWVAAEPAEERVAAVPRVVSKATEVFRKYRVL